MVRYPVPLSRVICMGCGNTSPRQPFQDLLAELNPGAADHVKRLVAAGHDAEAARQRSLRVGASEEEIRQVCTLADTRLPHFSTSGALGCPEKLRTPRAGHVCSAGQEWTFQQFGLFHGLCRVLLLNLLVPYPTGDKRYTKAPT